MKPYKERPAPAVWAFMAALASRSRTDLYHKYLAELDEWLSAVRGQAQKG